MRLENGNASPKRYFVAGIRVHMEPNEKGNAGRNGHSKWSACCFNPAFSLVMTQLGIESLVCFELSVDSSGIELLM